VAPNTTRSNGETGTTRATMTDRTSAVQTCTRGLAPSPRLASGPAWSPRVEALWGSRWQGYPLPQGGHGRLERDAEAEGGAAEEGALDEAGACGRDGSTPCPAVGVRRALEGCTRRRGDAVEVEGAAVAVLAGEVSVVPLVRFDRFGGRTPCPAVAAVGVVPTVPLRKFCGSTPCPVVRRILSAANSASMRRQ
jgi:hypothetical protein